MKYSLTPLVFATLMLVLGGARQSVSAQNSGSFLNLPASEQSMLQGDLIVQSPAASGSSAGFYLTLDGTNAGYGVTLASGSLVVHQIFSNQGKWQWVSLSGTGMSVDGSGNLVLGSGTSVVTISAGGRSTFTGSITITGTDNQLPNQILASGGKSILTQALADSRYLGKGAQSIGAASTNPTCNYSSSLGAGSVGDYSWAATAMGCGYASGPSSTAMGTSGALTWATAGGNNAYAYGTGATAFGYGVYAGGFGSVAIGSGIDIGDDPFQQLMAWGDYSIAMGCGATTTGPCSVAMGDRTKATDYGATAFGVFSEADGYQSTALGCSSVTHSGLWALAGGAGYASNGYAIALGHGNATGWSSLAVGDGSLSSGRDSVALGSSNASGDYSTALGYLTVAQGAGQTVVGRYNKAIGTNDFNSSADPIFIVGNGTSENERSNAVVISRSGNMALAGNFTANGLAVTGTTVSVPLESGSSVDTVVASGNSNLVLIPQQGDLSMGQFVAGTPPPSQQ